MSGFLCRFLTGVKEHLLQQPDVVAANLLYVQAMYGSTGDLTPWHGHVTDPRYNITGNSEEFLQYAREVNIRLCAEYQVHVQLCMSLIITKPTSRPELTEQPASVTAMWCCGLRTRTLYRVLWP